MKEFTKYDPKSSDKEVIESRSRFQRFVDAIKQFNAEQRQRNEQGKMFWKFAFNAANPEAVPALLNQLAEMYPTHAKMPMQAFGQQVEACIKEDKTFGISPELKGIETNTCMNFLKFFSGLELALN